MQRAPPMVAVERSRRACRSRSAAATDVALHLGHEGPIGEPGRPVHVLVGRDVLRFYRLTIDGARGLHTLAALPGSSDMVPRRPARWAFCQPPRNACLY